MSYDISVSAKILTGGEDAWTSVWERNFTYNNSAALNEAGLRLRDLNGKMCSQVVEKIADVVRQFQTEPARFKKHEPSNGWGGYDDCVDMLNGLLAACRRTPLGEIHVY